MVIELSGELVYNTSTLMRKLGYSPHFDRYKKEMTYVKKIQGRPFPRFHIHIKEEKDNYLKINLHFDAKRESYKGVSMHSGEYDSNIVKEEAKRIKIIFAELVKENNKYKYNNFKDSQNQNSNKGIFNKFKKWFN